MTDSAPAATLAVDSRCTLGEGIVWDDRRRCLFWTDILSRRLWRHDPAAGATRHWDLPEPLGCLALCDDGRLLLALSKSLRIAALPENGDPPELSHLADIEPELGPATRSNDGRCDRHGNFVFGTKSELDGEPAIGHLYQFSARHGLRRLALPALAIPNSICFSPDGRTLYWCDSQRPLILRADYDPDTAAVRDPRVFAESADGRIPDGSTTDAAGGLWNAQWDGARAVRYAPDGRMDRTVALPAAGNPSCCAIGGAALDTLYATSARIGTGAAALAAMPHAGGVFAAPLAAGAGLPEARFATA